MNLFYTKKVDNAADPAEFLLEDQEAVHASRVLRIEKGGRITATDGQGTIYKGRVTAIAGNLLRVAVTGKTEHPKPVPDVAIAIGNIKKRDRLEFAVE
jgi:16S rRNA (uracil1498-N3)-methyltransferase